MKIVWFFLWLFRLRLCNVSLNWVVVYCAFQEVYGEAAVTDNEMKSIVHLLDGITCASSHFAYFSLQQILHYNRV